MLSGDNGILQRATDAKEQTGIGQEKETIALAYNSVLAKKVSNGDSSVVTAGDLNPELTNQGASADGSNPITVTFTNSKRQYTINSNGTIEYAGIQSEENSENDWIVAWTYDGTNWSGPNSSGTTLSGKIIAKVYETTNKTTVFNPTTENNIEMNAYKLQITGEGNMGDWSDDEYENSWKEYALENGIYLGSIIREVSISNGITSIQGYAFSSMTLDSCVIPNSVKEIGERAFELANITNFTIPSNLTSIGDYAFASSSLTNVTISTNDIGEGAFSESGLTSVIVQEGVTTISEHVFNGCADLTTITIPNSLTTIGGYAFANCSQLNDVYYNGTSSDFNRINIGDMNSYFTNANLHCSQTDGGNDSGR